MTEGDGATDSKAAPTLQTGELVANKYRIERLIGSGGMAEVYSAVNILTDRRVALKWILPILAQSREVMLRFRREALAAGRINHPNVVAIFDVVEHQGSACMVLELLDGELLSDRLLRLGPLPFIEAVAILLPAMRGVAAAHAQGVIHRDIKPHNIFLCLEGDGAIREVKVLDFGVSKLTVADVATAGDITLSGNVVGTPEYMAPEQIRSGTGIDHRIDVYSLGVVLYEMLAGRPPFVNQHFSGLMLEIMQQEPPPLARFRPDVPRRLAGVIQRAMLRDPDRRFPDVPTFIQALEMVARDELKMIVGTPPEGVVTRAGFPRPTPTPLPSSSGSRPLNDQARPGWRTLLVPGALAIALGTAGALLALHRQSSSRASARAAAAAKLPVATKVTDKVAAAPTPETSPATAPPVPVSPAPTGRPETGSPVAGSGLPAAGAPAAPTTVAAPPATGPSSTPRPEGSATHSHASKRHLAEAAKPAGTGGSPGVVGAASDAASTTKAVPHPRPARAGKLSVDDF
jgi:serine/threonine-protein kinase